MPLTVTKLARACHLARSTVLYYESIGLLPRPRRTPGNYRVYTEKDLARLRQACSGHRLPGHACFGRYHPQVEIADLQSIAGMQRAGDAGGQRFAVEQTAVGRTQIHHGDGAASGE